MEKLFPGNVALAGRLAKAVQSRSVDWSKRIFGRFSGV
jgi:hypothetical protein